MEDSKSLTMILKEIQNKDYDSPGKEGDKPINFLQSKFDKINNIKPKTGWNDNSSTLEFNESWSEDRVTKFKFLNVEKENEDEEEKDYNKNSLSDDGSNNSDNEDDKGNKWNEIPADTIQILKKEFEFPIEKVYNNVKVEELKGRGWTRGHEFEDLIKINPKISVILEEAANEFTLCSSKSREILRENNIIGFNPEHFAMFLYCQPIDLDIKTQYLFDSKEDFAVKVRHKFVGLFTFREVTIKEFILSILF